MTEYDSLRIGYQPSSMVSYETEQPRMRITDLEHKNERMTKELYSMQEYARILEDKIEKLESICCVNTE